MNDCIFFLFLYAVLKNGIRRRFVRKHVFCKETECLPLFHGVET